LALDIECDHPFGAEDPEMRHHRLRPLLFAALCLDALACSAAFDAPEQPGTPMPVTRLRAEPYSFAGYSGLRQSERLVVRDAATWAAIWRNVTSAPLPSVDFDREMIVVAALGERPTGGFDIVVESATASGDALTVRIRTIAPGPSCITTDVLTQPVDVARLPRTADVVRFVDDASVVDCR
jgi:hypothetical protein